jgi:hypothetical protein
VGARCEIATSNWGDGTRAEGVGWEGYLGWERSSGGGGRSGVICGLCAWAAATGTRVVSGYTAAYERGGGP